MATINVVEIQQDPLGWLNRVQSGETLVVLKQDQPIAEVRPIARQAGCRPAGLCVGEFKVPDDFDAPLPDELLHEFDGA
jgi:antitoxin (DNA-binding transcriptional repressor) of toxin-antitoxin stability system